MSDDELKALVASLAAAQQEVSAAQKETDRQLKELGKQIGGLGEKFGSFTEGLALPSMAKILSERFGMEVISPKNNVYSSIDRGRCNPLPTSNSFYKWKG